ncbi:MAG: hypothetical protein LBN27_09220 [Prevotellaceae bacterium]|jgi:hypothetical protein|nr:hypothetical protein [Prevotellaceae bacterium]
MNTEWINRTYEGLYEQTLQTRNYLDGNFGKFGVEGTSAAWVNNVFKPAQTNYGNAVLAWQNEAERTPAKITTLHTTHDALVPLYRELNKMLRGLPTVTDTDLQEMALPKRSASGHTPVPVPASYPVASIDIGTIRHLTLHYTDSHTGKRGKPHGVAGAVIRWAILPEPPIDVEDLRNSILDTATPFSLDFREDERHQTVYFCLAWQNTRGERGVWGEIIRAIIP